LRPVEFGAGEMVSGQWSVVSGEVVGGCVFVIDQDHFTI
jgi:hypothetical protein